MRLDTAAKKRRTCEVLRRVAHPGEVRAEKPWKAPPVLLLHSLGMLSINVAIDVTNGEH